LRKDQEGQCPIRDPEIDLMAKKRKGSVSPMNHIEKPGKRAARNGGEQIDKFVHARGHGIFFKEKRSGHLRQVARSP